MAYATVTCSASMVAAPAWASAPATSISASRFWQLNRHQLSYHLRGRGFPVGRRGPRGDYWVTVVPMFPEQLSADQEILLDQLIATSSGLDGQASNHRLHVWNQGLRTGKRELLKRSR